MKTQTKRNRGKEEMAREIAGCIDSGEWSENFDEDIYAHGLDFARNREVEEIKVEWLEADCVNLTAIIKNGHRRSHKVEVTLWKDRHEADWLYDTNCTCPYAYFCGHAAAIFHCLPEGEALVSYLLGKGGVPRMQKAILPQEKQGTSVEATRLRATPKFSLHVQNEVLCSKVLRYYTEKFSAEKSNSRVLVYPQVTYGSHALPLVKDETEREVEGGEEGKQLIIERDTAEEEAAARQLQRLGLINLGRDVMWRAVIRTEDNDGRKQVQEGWFADPMRFTEALFWQMFRAEGQASLESQGWGISMADNVGFHILQASPDQWDAQLEEQAGGWFDLSVGFVVAGKRYDLLPILANMLEEGYLEETLDRPDSGFYFANLPDGTALQIPLGRVRGILRSLASIIRPKHNQARLHALDAVGLAEQNALTIATTRSLKKLGRSLRDFKGMEPVDVPPGIQAKLRDYQVEGFRWMQFLAGHGLSGILADDMGLGKTLQTLAHILAEKERSPKKHLTSLVVAPTSVVPNWKAETEKFAPSLRVLVLHGSERKKFFSTMGHANIVITSYALLHRDIDRLKKENFHIVILDEAQHIKNSASKVNQSACQLMAKHRVCLTGTPVENHLGEVWSQFRFLMPGFLGSKEDFRRRFQKPIENEGDTERADILRKRLAPLILRRTKDKVAKELPRKTEIIHRIELATAQKDLYEVVRSTMDKRVRDAIAQKGLARSHILFLEALLKLRQICCHPKLLDIPAAQKARSGKMEFLEELLRTLIEEGRRILLFSQFTSMLALIEQHLTACGIPYLKLTGASKNRASLVERFQSGEVPVFLISLKAGGTGLNLTAADTVIHYDPWWNPAVEAQATDRAYRIGQTQPVFVHKLICIDSVEERIQVLQSKKAALASDLLSAAERATKPDAEMMRSLLAPLEDDPE